MKNKLILILSIILSLAFSSEIKDKTIQVINDFYNQQDIQIDEFKFSISKKIKKEIQNKVKQKFYRNQIYYWTIKIDDKIHYALMDNTIGKTMPITFLVIFNENQEVIHSSIIKYREAYGGEVAGESWLDQFTNYTDTSNYKVGKAISGISGASISVHSVSKGIKKLSILIHQIMKDFDE